MRACTPIEQWRRFQSDGRFTQVKQSKSWQTPWRARPPPGKEAGAANGSFAPICCLWQTSFTPSGPLGVVSHDTSHDGPTEDTVLKKLLIAVVALGCLGLAGFGHQHQPKEGSHVAYVADCSHPQVVRRQGKREFFQIAPTRCRYRVRATTCRAGIPRPSPPVSSSSSPRMILICQVQARWRSWGSALRL